MRLAFIGGWGHHTLGRLLTSMGDEIEAVAFAGDGADDPRAQAKAAKINGARWFDDARQMLDQFRPHVVNVGAVYAHNAQCIAAAIERDIPVVSDKPIATTWAQLDNLRQLAAANPKRVIVTEFGSRSGRAVRAARDAVTAGLIGQIVLATGQKSYRFGERPAWYADRDLYGGMILWVASHAIDYVRFASGLRYRRVVGQSANIAKPQFGSMEETTVSLFELENGAPAVVHADYNRPAKAPTHGDDRMRLAGSRGVLEIRDGRCLLITDDREETDITDEVAGVDGSLAMFQAALGQPSDAYGTQASLETAAVLLAARDAADERKLVEIPCQ